MEWDYRYRRRLDWANSPTANDQQQDIFRCHATGNPNTAVLSFTSQQHHLALPVRHESQRGQESPIFRDVAGGGRGGFFLCLFSTHYLRVHREMSCCLLDPRLGDVGREVTLKKAPPHSYVHTCVPLHILHPPHLQCKSHSRTECKSHSRTESSVVGTFGCPLSTAASTQYRVDPICCLNTSRNP
jgi:hypothetical protein